MMRVRVLDGTGSIGRLVVTRLLELGDTPRVLSRNPDRAHRTLASDVTREEADVVAGDLTAASLTPALGGVDAVVMTPGAPYGSGDYEAMVR
jgi:uncharacterized protein YbjT (DUF2867 family)